MSGFWVMKLYSLVGEY